jgi:hypothetical protein
VETHATPAGILEYIRMPLGEPDDLLPDMRLPLGTPRWFFAGYSTPQLKKYFRTLDLTPEQRDSVLNSALWETAPEGAYVTPSLQLVAELGRGARSAIYAALAGSPVNAPQHYPFRFPMDAIDDRFGDSGMTAPAIETLKQLLYVEEGALCFADGAAAQRMMSSNDFKALVKALYREPTFLMRLRVTSDSNIKRLLGYWARCGRERDLKPLFESLALVPGGGSLNIEHLLPPFARLRLYTHGPKTTDAAKSRQNCFWTALNFFNEQPDAQFLDGESVLRTVRHEYHPPDGPRQFGDLICLMDPRDHPAHICVYIADDVVFTKDGLDDRQPWVLLKMADMLVEYPAKPPFKVVTLRKNGF